MSCTKKVIGSDTFWIESGKTFTDDAFVWKEKFDKKSEKKFYVNQKSHEKKWVLPGEKKDKKDKSDKKEKKDKKDSESKEKKEKSDKKEKTDKKEKKDKEGESKSKEKKEKKDKSDKKEEGGATKEKEKKEKKGKSATDDSSSKDKEKKEKDKKEKKSESSDSSPKAKEKKDKEGESKSKEKKEKKDKSDKKPSEDGSPAKEDKSKEKKEKKDKKEKDPSSPDASSKEKKEKKDKKADGDDGSARKEKREKKEKKQKEELSSAYSGFSVPGGGAHPFAVPSAFSVPKDFSSEAVGDEGEDKSETTTDNYASPSSSRMNNFRGGSESDSSPFSLYGGGVADNSTSLASPFGLPATTSSPAAATSPTTSGVGSPALGMDEDSPKGPARPISSFLPPSMQKGSEDYEPPSATYTTRDSPPPAEKTNVDQLLDSIAAAQAQLEEDRNAVDNQNSSSTPPESPAAVPVETISTNPASAAGQSTSSAPLMNSLPPRPTTPPPYEAPVVPSASAGGPFAAAGTPPQPDKDDAPVVTTNSTLPPTGSILEDISGPTSVVPTQAERESMEREEEELDSEEGQKSPSYDPAFDLIPSAEASSAPPPVPSTFSSYSIPSASPTKPVEEIPVEAYIPPPTRAKSPSPPPPPTSEVQKSPPLPPPSAGPTEPPFSPLEELVPAQETTTTTEIAPPPASSSQLPPLPPKAPTSAGTTTTLPPKNPMAGGRSGSAQTNGRSGSVASSLGGYTGGAKAGGTSITSESPPASLRWSPDVLLGNSRGPTPPNDNNNQQEEGGWENNSQATPSVASLAPGRSGSAQMREDAGRQASMSSLATTNNNPPPSSLGGGGYAPTLKPAVGYVDNRIEVGDRDDKYHDLTARDVADLREELARAKRAGNVGGSSKPLSAYIADEDEDPADAVATGRAAAAVADEKNKKEGRLVQFKVSDYEDAESLAAGPGIPSSRADDGYTAAEKELSEKENPTTTSMYSYGSGSAVNYRSGMEGGGRAPSEVGSHVSAATRATTTIPASLAVISDVELQDEFSTFCAAYDKASTDKSMGLFGPPIEDKPIHPGKMESLEVLHRASAMGGYQAPVPVPMEEMSQLRLQQLQPRIVPRAEMSSRMQELQRHEIDAAMTEDEKRYRQRLIDQMSQIEEKKRVLRQQLDELEVKEEDFSKASKVQLERQRQLVEYHKKEFSKTAEVVWEYFLTKVDRGEADIGLIESLAF